MTREDAINLLDNLTGMVEDNHNSDYDTALKMGIKALEQEPCEDAISRQAVLKIFSYVMDYWAEHAIDVEPHEIKDAIIEQYTFTAEKLSKLPPVTPQQKTGHWIKTKVQYETAYSCTNCKRLVGEKSDYCPNCGANMRGE